VLKDVDPAGAARRGFLVVPLFLLVATWRGRYHALRRADLDLGTTSITVALALVATQALLFLAALPGPRTLVAGFALASVPALLVGRALHLAGLRALRRRRFDPHHVLLVGPAAAFDAWRDRTRAHPEWGHVEVDRIDATPEAVDAVLGRRVVDEVHVAGPTPEALDAIAARCEELGVPYSLDARFAGPRVSAHLHDLDGLPVLSFGATALTPERLAKRVLDVLLALPLLALAAPVLAVAAVAIRAHDGAPALLRQERVGRHGRRFAMWKLRSMRPDAHREHEAVRAAEGAEAPAFKPASDPRITPVGRWLRRFSIDELPQLVNVLRGEMSLVGPRPPLPSEVARYERWQLRRLSVPPGMTGLWQVSGRADLPFERWMALDLEYVDRWSLGMDLWLLARTVPAVLGGSGAR
jgi:exopolysaccharide biosynthesis polyprenyl glycosylphosphotransferase